MNNRLYNFKFNVEDDNLKIESECIESSSSLSVHVGHYLRVSTL